VIAIKYISETIGIHFREKKASLKK